MRRRLAAETAMRVVLRDEVEHDKRDSSDLKWGTGNWIVIMHDYAPM
jgi:hypothetical protein